MPARKGSGKQMGDDSSILNPQDSKLYKFAKDEIVFAKMKFFSAWPAKVIQPFQVRGDAYKKKKPMAPKVQVQFFDNPPTIGEIHHNQVFKFEENYKKYAVTSNQKLILGIKQAKAEIPKAGRDRILAIQKEMAGYMNFGSDDEDSITISEVEIVNQEIKSEKVSPVKEAKSKEHSGSKANEIEAETVNPENLTIGQDVIEEKIVKEDLKQETGSIHSVSSKSEFEPGSCAQKDSKVVSKVEAEDKDLKESEKIEESESPEMSVQEDKKKEEKSAFFNGLSSIGSKPKRTPKPTQVYEIFQSQQAHNKRVKKQNEKEREMKRQLKEQQAKEKSDEQKIKDNFDSTIKSLKKQQIQPQPQSQLQSLPAKEIIKPPTGKEKQDSLITSKKNTQESERKQNVNRKQSSRIQTDEGSKHHAGQLSLNKEQSTQSVNANQPMSQKQINKEKIAKMKDIKKYFDTFFKELKDMNKQILNINESLEVIPPKKSEEQMALEADLFQQIVQKTYKRLQLSSTQICHQISQVFHEYNELSLIHESKLGHALKDMQQFLEFYQSKDDIIDGILSKLDMIIEQQEKKMQIEIFGEHTLQQDTMRNHLMGGREHPKNQRSNSMNVQRQDDNQKDCFLPPSDIDKNQDEYIESSIAQQSELNASKVNASSNDKKHRHSKKKTRDRSSVSKQNSETRRLAPGMFSNFKVTSGFNNPLTNPNSVFQNLMIQNQWKMQINQLNKQNNNLPKIATMQNLSLQDLTQIQQLQQNINLSQQMPQSLQSMQQLQQLQQLSQIQQLQNPLLQQQMQHIQQHQSQQQCNSLNLTILNHGQNFMSLQPQNQDQNMNQFGAQSMQTPQKILGKHSLQLHKKLQENAEKLKRAKSDSEALKSGSTSKQNNDKVNEEQESNAEDQKSESAKQDQMQKAINGCSIQNFQSLNVMNAQQQQQQWMSVINQLQQNQQQNSYKQESEDNQDVKQMQDELQLVQMAQQQNKQRQAASPDVQKQ